MTRQLNGWDMEAVGEAIEMVREQPEAGRLTWRSHVEWDGGFGLDVRTDAIEQLGQPMPRHFTLRGDHPPELLGQNTGVTAVETYLAALGACMAGTFAAQATMREIELRRLRVEVKGVIDLNGFFGLKPVAPGVSEVELHFQVDTDADPAVLREVLEAARSHSPIHDSVTQPVSVSTTLDRLP